LKLTKNPKLTPVLKFRPVFLGLLLALKVTLWPLVLLAGLVLLFALTDVPFAVSDTDITSGAWGLIIKVVLLALGGATTIGGVSVQIAPLLITGFMYVLTYRFYRKHLALVNWLSVLSSAVFLSLLVMLMQLIDRNFNWKISFNPSLIVPLIMSLVISVLPWLWTQVQNPDSQIRQFSEGIIQKFAEVSSFLRLVRALKRFLLTGFLILFVIGLGLSTIQLVLNWTNVAQSFTQLAHNWWSMIGLIGLNILFLPNLPFLNLNQFVNLFGVLNMCPISNWCAPVSQTDGPISLGFMNLIFPTAITWVQVLLILSLFGAGIIFNIVVSGISSGDRTSGKNILKLYLTLLVFLTVALPSLILLRQLAGVRIGNYWATGTWGFVTLIGFSLIFGVLVKSLFDYARIQFQQSRSKPPKSLPENPKLRSSKSIDDDYGKDDYGGT
jgi:hypothetical protein